MNKLTSEEVQKIFQDGEKKDYEKFGKFLFRGGRPGETVLTILNGRLETVNQATVDDTVVKNLNVHGFAEMYVINSEKFKQRYQIINKDPFVIDNVTWGHCTPIGKARAMQYQGEPMKFDAPWGEEMACVSGDYIASPLDDEGNSDPKDIYRIEKSTFEDTYKLIGS